jgi:hypothetical protein
MYPLPGFPSISGLNFYVKAASALASLRDFPLKKMKEYLNTEQKYAQCLASQQPPPLTTVIDQMAERYGECLAKNITGAQCLQSLTRPTASPIDCSSIQTEPSRYLMVGGMVLCSVLVGFVVKKIFENKCDSQKHSSKELPTLAVVKRLIENHTSIESQGYRTEKHQQIFTLEVPERDFDHIEEALEAYKPLSTEDEEGNPALLLSAKEGIVEISAG